jgi:hypothetical protein
MISGRARRRSSRELYHAAIENLDVRFTPKADICSAQNAADSRGGILVKKLLVVICSAVLAFGLAGCIGKGKAPVGKGKAPVVQTRG